MSDDAATLFDAIVIGGHEAAFGASGSGAIAREGGWFLFDSGTGVGALNYCAPLTIGVDPAVAEAWYRERKATAFSVLLLRPGHEGLEAALATRGYREEPPKPLMTHPLPAGPVDEVEGVRMERVDSDARIRQYLAARHDPGREAPPDDVEAEFVAKAIATGQFAYFVALAGELPLATSMAFESAGVLAVNNVWVREEWRRKGLGRAVTQVAMGAFPGSRVACLEATAMGEQLYRSMGWATEGLIAQWCWER